MNDLYYYQPKPKLPAPVVVESDICIYGATSGGIIAALQAKRLGRRVELLAFGGQVGGMTAGGLGHTDIGNKQAIGGLSRQFYKELGAYYGSEINWMFEPHVAQATFLRLMEEAGVQVRLHSHLAGVTKEGNQITEITLENERIHRAAMFIDATYEGDLMAKAGVSYHVGREGNATYGELFNGVHFGSPNHNFNRFVDPYKVAGAPRSGLLAGISGEAPGRQGEGDHRIQAYNFRLCLTKRDEIKRPFPCPEGYDPERYTLLARYIATGVWDSLRLTVFMPNGKTDTNNYGGFSSDHIGANYQWPEGSYAVREEIFQDHVNYMQGMLWFLSHDTQVPQAVRDEVQQWGLPCDEFVTTGGWPHELYIREARRLVSDLVMTEHHCVGQSIVNDPVGLAAYTMDSHNCQRIVIGGRAFNEGNVEMGGFTPYGISYRSIIPKEQECANLLVPFCLSASHIAFGSIRMEPVFMGLSQSAATAAHLAIQEACPVQKVAYPQLRKQLLADGQVLQWNA